jgi:hypothetical protein
VLVDDLTGYQDTAIWNALYNFQKDAATGVINKLETYNGVQFSASFFGASTSTDLFRSS